MKRPKGQGEGPGLEFFGRAEAVEVASWCPSPNGEGPATQVHIVLRSGDVAHVIRLKSKAAADSLIAALREHTDYVWPEGGPVEGHAATYKAHTLEGGGEASSVRCACGWGVDTSGPREVAEGFYRAHMRGLRMAEDACRQRHSATRPEE